MLNITFEKSRQQVADGAKARYALVMAESAAMVVAHRQGMQGRS